MTLNLTFLSDRNICKATQSANTVESGGDPTGSESSQTTSLSETKEESGAAKKSESGAAEKSEKESNSSSSQQNSAVPSVVPSLQESSTEELLKILEEGNLSEVSTVFRTSTQRFKSYT